MPHRPRRLPRPHWLLGLPLLAALAGVAWPPPALALSAPAAVAAQASAWWSAYDDPLLAELLARSPARPGLLLRGYVELRVAALQADIAGRLLELSAARVAALQRAAVPDDTVARAAMQTAAQRQHRFALLQQATEAEADHRLATLAALGGLDEQALRQAVTASATLPQVHATLPTPEPPPLRQDDPSSLAREWARQGLLDAAERAQRSRALLQAAQLQREAVRLRQGAQAAGDDALAEAETQWLLQAAQAAGAEGQLALAWSQWLQAGGAALVSSGRPEVQPRAGG